MPFEDSISELNEWHFFKEFVYAQNNFRPAPNQEVELADNIIWLDNLLIAFQIKEREASPEANEETERRWFERKVLRKATQQTRDTLKYLSENESIEVTNLRGDTFGLKFADIEQFHKLVVYHPSAQLPPDCLKIKFHQSRTADTIHIIASHDYLGIIQTLLTPAEFAEYLSFREELIEIWGAEVNQVPEPAIVGQFLYGSTAEKPSVQFLDRLRALNIESDDWDMSGVIAHFPDRARPSESPTDYYPIVRELASLKRNELREFKRRFQLSIEKAKSDVFCKPFRIATPRTDCGFVFIPITKEFLPHRRIGLQNFTLAHKYDLKLSKCIGISIADHSEGWFDVEWCYVEAPWAQDPEIERVLRDNNPFRDIRETELARYHFKSTKT
jgi:hypothetical protein